MSTKRGDLTFGVKKLAAGEWSWTKHVDDVGGKEVVSLIVNQNASFGILSALLLSLLVGPLLTSDSAPAGEEGSTAETVYLIMLLAAVMSCLLVIYLSVWIVANLNALVPTDAVVKEALALNHTQTFISLIVPSLFNLSIAASVGALLAGIYVFHSRTIFWTGIGMLVVMLVIIGAMMAFLTDAVFTANGNAVRPGPNGEAVEMTETSTGTSRHPVSALNAHS
eukprot:m.293580 g.293580  ORF g.293580 m.293580 type:complete len:223 (-) comp12829_c0_seq1:1368-2036(-)